LGDEAADQSWQDRRPNGFHSPAEYELGGCAANASLAGTHPATGLELGIAPAIELADPADSDIFAATKERVMRGQGFEFGA